MQVEGPSKVLGIVSSGWAPAGLSYAYATDYIKSVIDSLLAQMRDNSKKVKVRQNISGSFWTHSLYLME